jgi:hypothetical protein
MALAPKKTAVLTVRLSPEVKAALRSSAAAERRSLTNMLEIVILDYCERHPAQSLPKKARARIK